MIPGMNPRKMKQMMRQMGIQQTEIAATEVIIRTEDSEIVVTSPSVAKVNMMGQETFQISGEIEERQLSTTPDISEEDISTVSQQTGKSEEESRKAIEAAEGDLAEAIMNLQKDS